MSQIRYFLALQSPWVYLAGRRPWQVAAAHGLGLVAKPLDPGQLFPRMGGKVRQDRHPARNAYATQDRLRQAAKLGMPMLAEPLFRSANPAPASYALIAAQAAGGDVAAYVETITSALWVEDRDISSQEVIGAALLAAGVDPGLADRGLLMGAETYAANLEEAVGAGVFGVPFLIWGHQMFWGQDRIEDLDLALAGKL